MIYYFRMTVGGAEPEAKNDFAITYFLNQKSARNRVLLNNKLNHQRNLSYQFHQMPHWQSPCDLTLPVYQR